MKTALFVLFASLFLASTRGESDASSDVLVLNKNNFQSTIDANPLILLEFYAPWCGHCKALAPEYEKAATELKGKIPLAKVDCTVEEELCQEQGVRGYPTLKVFSDGRESPYEGPRKADGIISFLERESLPAITLIKTKEEVTEFLTKAKKAVLGLFENDHDDRYKTFESFAKRIRQNVPAIAFIGEAADLIKEYGAKIAPSVVLFHGREDEPHTVYDGELNDNDVDLWLHRNSRPLFGEVNGDTHKTYVDAKLPLAFAFLDPEEEEKNKPVIEKLKELAKDGRDKASIAWINAKMYANQYERLGLKALAPALVVEDYETGKKYAYSGQGETFLEGVSGWWKDFLAGTLQATIKSQDIPEDNSGPVTVVVAKSFDDIVMDSSKDVLLEVYAPWCGHCQQLAPTYEKLGEHFKGIDSVVIANFDGANNDLDRKYNVRGFPTILFFPANSKEAISYEGSRSLEDMIRFIKENKTTQFDFPEYTATGDDDEDDEEDDEEEDGHEHDEL